MTSTGVRDSDGSARSGGGPADVPARTTLASGSVAEVRARMQCDAHSSKVLLLRRASSWPGRTATGPARENTADHRALDGEAKDAHLAVSPATLRTSWPAPTRPPEPERSRP